MATLAPSPKSKFFDSNGEPLANGKLYTYAAGTTTPLATYTDAGGSTANLNPVILDSRGEASVWLGGASYKFVLKDSTDALIYTVDNISPPTDSAGAATYSNKTFDNTNTITVKDSAFTLQDNGDTTKQALFQLSGLSTATTRTYALPDANGTLFLNSMPTARILGRTTAGTGAIENISVGTGLTLSGGSLTGAAATTSALGDVELATQAEATAFTAGKALTADVIESVFKNEQMFSSSGTWTKPAGVTRVFVEVQGGGQGGGGASTATGNSAGVGASGGYARGWVDVTGNVTVTVGAGGAGGTGTIPSAGSAGGTSSFGTAISATGGSAGVGGVGSGGTINAKGDASSASFYTGATPQVAPNSAGVAGILGAGGGAAATSIGGGDFTGGAGGDGFVLVRW